MYLIDTTVISEARKHSRANRGVRAFFADAANAQALFLSVVSIGEIRRGALLARDHGDSVYATQLEQWVAHLIANYEQRILDFDQSCAREWAKLLVPNAQNHIDKQIAATARVYGLTLVTRNTQPFEHCGVAVLSPFTLDH